MTQEAIYRLHLCIKGHVPKQGKLSRSERRTLIQCKELAESRKS